MTGNEMRLEIRLGRCPNCHKDVLLPREPEMVEVRDECPVCDILWIRPLNPQAGEPVVEAISSREVRQHG